MGTGWDRKGGEGGLVSEDSVEKCCAWDKERQQVEHRFLSACTLPFQRRFSLQLPPTTVTSPSHNLAMKSRLDSSTNEQRNRNHGFITHGTEPFGASAAMAGAPSTVPHGRSETGRTPDTVPHQPGERWGWGGGAWGVPAHSLHSACVPSQTLCLRTITIVPQRQSSPGAASWRAQAGCWNQ